MSLVELTMKCFNRYYRSYFIDIHEPLTKLLITRNPTNKPAALVQTHRLGQAWIQHIEVERDIFVGKYRAIIV